jgi:hypothetical protein
MQEDRLHDLVADRVHRAQGTHRFLEDHRRQPASDAEQPVVLLGQCGDIDRLFAGGSEGDLPADDLAGLLNQPQDRVSRHALAAARFADDGKDRTPLHRERHAVDGSHFTFVGVEVRAKIVHFQ